MIEVVSLVGVSYSGKSTLAEAVKERLGDEDLEADIIKKDDAMKAIGSKRYGSSDTTGGYSIRGFLRHGQVPSSELHEWMNGRVSSCLELGKVAILEGGTRTRSAQAETLNNIELDEDGLRIFMLDLPFQEVLSRARQRRQVSGRYDDLLPVALAKLYGQYRGIHSEDAPQPDNLDVTVLDASLPIHDLASIVSDEIVSSRSEA